MQRVQESTIEAAKEQRQEMFKIAEAMEKLQATEQWKMFLKLMEQRASTMVQSLVADDDTGDGLSQALRTAKTKGAFSELNFILSYPARMVKEAAEERKRLGVDEAGNKAS